MSETPETQVTVPEGTPKIKGVCLIEIWRTGGNKAPSVFWREVQADGTFSLWRFMEPSFAKKALKVQRFTLDKDGHEVQYAVRAFDSAKKATTEDYRRIRKLQTAFREASDPVMLCRACQGSKEIQATRPLPGGKVLRVVCECPECAPAQPKPEGDEGTTSTAEETVQAQLKAIGTYTIVEEVPGVDPAEQFYVRGPDGLPLKLSNANESVTFATADAARQHLRLMLVPDECIEHEAFEP